MKHLFTFLLVILITGSVAAQPSKTTYKQDSIQIRTTIMSFYNWYQHNYSKLEFGDLYVGTKSPGKPPYKIDWKKAEKYFVKIRTYAPQLGEAFIVNLRKFLHECDSAFKKEPDGEVPYGFDYDWYTNSQEEASYLTDELKKAKQWIITVDGLNASVDVLGFYMDGTKKIETVVMCFVLKKEKGKWKIAKIGCPYNEPPPMEEIKTPGQ